MPKSALKWLLCKWQAENANLATPNVDPSNFCPNSCDLKPSVYPCAFKNQIQYKEAEGSSYREGSYPETPGTPKRSQRSVDQDRTFIPDPAGFGGERVIKRDQKRKAPGRPSEAPSSPAQSKRPRKLKTSDE